MYPLRFMSCGKLRSYAEFLLDMGGFFRDVKGEHVGRRYLFVSLLITGLYSIFDPTDRNVVVFDREWVDFDRGFSYTHFRLSSLFIAPFRPHSAIFDHKEGSSNDGEPTSTASCISR